MAEQKRFANVVATVELIIEVPLDCEELRITNGIFAMSLDEAVRNGRWVNVSDPRVIYDRIETV